MASRYCWTDCTYRVEEVRRQQGASEDVRVLQLITVLRLV